MSKKINKNNYWWILGLLLPPVGIVLYFVWRKNKKDDAKSIITGTIVSSVIWAIFGLSFLASGKNNDEESVPNYVQEVDVTQASKEIKNWYTDVSSGASVVTVIASSTCPHCQNLKPIITASSKKNKFKLYFFEADKLKDEDYQIISNAIELDGYEGYVPYTFVIKNKEFKGSNTGEMTDSVLKDFLIQTEVLED
jgi:thiol-disulfide isomerase/thioredoxin